MDPSALVTGPKTNANTSIELKSNNQTMGYSDAIYIYGSSFITEIGDISKFRPYDVKLYNATCLKKLIIGSNEEGYVGNSLLEGLDLSNCKLLEELNIAGCSAISVLDLTNNGLLKKLDARNTNLTSLNLPVGGVIEELYLGTVKNLEILNQTKLREFDCTDISGINRLRIENTPSIPVVEMLTDYLTQLTNGVRIVGLNEVVGDNRDFINLLLSDDAKGKYIDNNGVLSGDKTKYPYISGTLTVGEIDGATLKRLMMMGSNIILVVENVRVIGIAVGIIKNK